MKKYITQNKLKKNNTADIFTFILEKGKTTRREIEFETGFSWGTVSSNVAYLLEKGYVTEEKMLGSGVGRTTYALCPNGNIVGVGLDINRTELKAEVVGLDLSVKQTFSAEFNALTQEETLTIAENLCQTAIDWCKGKFSVFSLGVAIQGAVNGREGVSLRFPRIEEWQPCNVKERFALKFDLPVYLAHDPKCVLFARLCKKKYKDCVLARVDEGIGMAVAQDYKILDDTEKLELGHILTSTGEKLEDAASVRGVCKKTGLSFEESLSLKETLSGIGELALALYNACVLFRPQRLILTGRAFEYMKFKETLVEKLNDYGINAEVDLTLSAAFGVAAEAMKSAIKSAEI